MKNIAHSSNSNLTLDLGTPIQNILHDPVVERKCINLGITSLHQIQAQAVRKGLFFHKNFLICTPSGSGKTLIAELAIMHSVFHNLGKALYLVPYKALANEKGERFNHIFKDNNIHVSVITGDTEKEDPSWIESKVIITTYEKCDALMRSSNKILSDLSIIIIDEIHEISLSNRGARLELLLMVLTLKYPFVQIIALSATINNYLDFKDWLSSLQRPMELIHHTKRPIELKYKFDIGSNKFRLLRKHVKRTLSEKGQIIIFVTRRKYCVKFGQALQPLIQTFLTPEDQDLCAKAKKQLKKHNSMVTSLVDMINGGVAFHNASLGKFERAIVEKYFRLGAIKVLIATTTLAAGVNTPARTVIITDIIQQRKSYNLTEKDFSDPKFIPAFGKSGLIQPISPNLLFQMLGRAGRLGYDDQGEGIILLKDKDEAAFAQSYYFNLIREKEDKIRISPKYADLTSQLNTYDMLQEALLIFFHYFPDRKLIDFNKFFSRSMLAFFSKNKNQDWLTNLNIIPLQPKDYLRIWPLKSKGHYDLTINTISPLEISASITINQQAYNRYHVSFHATRGIHCSCNPSRFIKEINDLKKAPMCVHIRTFLTFVFEKEDNKILSSNFLSAPNIKLEGHQEQLSKNLSKRINTLIPLIFRQQFPLSFLVENGLLRKSRKKRSLNKLSTQSQQNQNKKLQNLAKMNMIIVQGQTEKRSSQIKTNIIQNFPNRKNKKTLHNNRYCLTALGNLAIRLYLTPDQVVNLVSWLENYNFNSELQTIQKIVQLSLDSISRPFDEVVDIILHWIHEYTVNFLLEKFKGFGVGDLFSLIHQISRNCGIFEQFSQFLGNENFQIHFHRMQLRIQHGIQEELVDLMERIPRLSRNQARVLYNAGYVHSGLIFRSNSEEIMKKTNLPLSKIRQIMGENISDSMVQTRLTQF